MLLSFGSGTETNTFHSIDVCVILKIVSIQTYYHVCVSTFFSRQLEESGDRVKSSEWFEKGAEYDCPYSALEAWRIKQKPQVNCYYTILLVGRHVKCA